jgi:hypothetical protein
MPLLAMGLDAKVDVDVDASVGINVARWWSGGLQSV